MDHRQPQARTTMVSPKQILLSKEFAAGVDDVRLGRAPRFGDPIGNDWNYERGRAWALCAPMRMPIKIRGKANSDALWLLVRAFSDGSIL